MERVLSIFSIYLKVLFSYKILLYFKFLFSENHHSSGKVRYKINNFQKNFLLVSATLLDIKDAKRSISNEVEIEKEKEHNGQKIQRHINPRALILKRQARDKIVPNIPLVFVHQQQNRQQEIDDPKVSRDPANNSIAKIKRFVQHTMNDKRTVLNKDRKDVGVNRERGMIQRKINTENDQEENTVKRNASDLNESVGVAGNIGDEQTHYDKARIEDSNQTVENISNVGTEANEENGDSARQRRTRSLLSDGNSRSLKHSLEEKRRKNNKNSTTSRDSVYERAVPFEELKSIDVVRKALTGDQFQKLKFIDDQKV